MFFSIITATYNSSSTVRQALQSLYNQSFQDYEHIIIDGYSTDSTLNIIEQCKSKQTKMISEPDNGMYDALNKGIKLANGEVVGFLHADDIYGSSDALQIIHDTFQKHNSDAVYGDLEYVRKENPSKVLRHWKSNEYNPSMLKNGWMPPHPTFYVKKSMYNQYGVFDISLEISSDYEIMMRFLGKFQISASYVPVVLVRMKTGGASNRNLSNIIKKSYEDYKVMKRHNIGGLNTLIMKNITKFKQFI